MALPMISTILAEAQKLRGKEKKIEFLRSHVHNKCLLMILKATCDAGIKFALPDTDPPYEESEFDEPSRIYQETRKFYLFLEPECGGNENLHQIKRERIFIELLESVNPEEAKVLLGMKNKRLPYKSLTGALINEAFPGLLSEVVKEKKKPRKKSSTSSKKKTTTKKSGTTAKKTTKKKEDSK